MENPALEAALAEYRAVEDAYVNALEAKGLRFAARGSSDARIAELRGKLRERGAVFRNAGASIVWGWLSPACVECTGARGSETFSTTFKCHRDCYFCFNFNQADYQHFFDAGCPWEENLSRCARENADLGCLGLTGGEPLLVLDESLRFLERAREVFPNAHKRMYTSGDLLTEDGAQRLRDAGLDEIRFSVKLEDSGDLRERVLENMALAKRHIPSVMVEMPVIPGSGTEMRELFRRFDEVGIDGINLLEFCFPFHRWEDFESRGFEIRNPPFDVMYDYGYSGGLPIADSEELALELMLFGIDKGVSYGMHYCSLDNKHRSEMRQRNEHVRNLPPVFAFDPGDFLIKAGKAFGPDRLRARELLDALSCPHTYEDDEEGSLMFPISYVEELKGRGCTCAIAIATVESAEDGAYLREIGLVRA